MDQPAAPPPAIVIAVDKQGTITLDGKVITFDQVLEALERASQAGKKIMMITGRQPNPASKEK